MAYQQAGSLPVKPSFAKIAAMAPPSNSKAKVHTQQRHIPPPQLPSERVAQVGPKAASRPPNVLPTIGMRTIIDDNKVQITNAGLERLVMEEIEIPIDQVEELHGPDGAPGGTDSTEDDQSHLSSSSTKGPSFDTKSMASVTTFAMDEKESLRPDDSASVQAGDEDEHLSPPASRAESSQPDSEISSLPVRFQARNNSTAINITSRRFPMTTLANPPRFGDFPLEQPDTALPDSDSVQQPPLPVDSSSTPGTRFIAVAPDEKLLDAMGSPKDRLLLLQLEEKLVAFITQSQDDFLDLPPQNSFGRLLAHKLADYYNLAHYISNDNSSVRLYRTACCSLPTPLGELANSIAANSGQPANATAFKIMRRTALGQGKLSANGSTAASSSVPSKATSEAGADTTSDEGVVSPVEATPAKDKSKWTREEKEAHYKAARERIFGDLQGPNASENNSTGETSTSISRSSSSSGKKKGHKQRAPKDDSFEARSSFIPGYGGMPYSTTPSQYQPQFPSPSYPVPYNANSGTVLPGPGYSNTTGQSFPPYEPPTAFTGMPGYSVGLPPQYGSNEGWSNPQSPQPGGFYNFNTSGQPSPMFSQHSSPMPSHAMSQYPQQTQTNFQPNAQSWTQTPYPGTFQPMSVMPNSPAVLWPQFPPHPPISSPGPYQYGQLPLQAYGNTFSPNTQHPVPGSFNRSIFNPQTRSFVPANSSPRFGGKPATSKAAVASAQKLGGGSAEQNRLAEASGPATTRAPQLSQTGSNGVALSNPQQESLQKKWGTPAHLPKKPPPSQVPSSFDLDSAPALPSQQGYQSLNNGVLNGSALVVPGGGSFSGNMKGGVAAG